MNRSRSNPLGWLIPFLFLAACAPSPTPTVLPTAVVTLEHNAVAPTQQPTQATLAAAADSDCTDSASFITDVTYPDNTNVPAGQTFVKTWRLKNTGTCTWSAGYTLVFASGDQMGGADSIPLQVTAPGATLDLSTNLVAPAADGAYTGNYELHDPSGSPVAIDGTRLMWVKITVGSGASLLSTPGGTNGSGTSGSCSYTQNASLLTAVVDLINQARASNGLPALTLNAQLSASAMAHSIDMACHSSLSHYGSDGSYFPDRMATAGYGGTYRNECIYAQAPEYGGDARAAVDWWLNDPTHRDILLNDKPTEIGAGYAYVAGSTEGGYFTVDFGGP
jgi:uncharacterized protein YkwD